MPKKKILLLTTGGTIASTNRIRACPGAYRGRNPGFPSLHEQYLPSGGQESLQYRQHQYDQRPLDADRRSH